MRRQMVTTIYVIIVNYCDVDSPDTALRWMYPSEVRYRITHILDLLGSDKGIKRVTFNM